MSSAEIIGKPLLRREDRRLLVGQGRYLDDLAVPGALHVCFVRSPYAHARIVSIDASAAVEIEGVVGVFTGVELAEWTTPLRMAPAIEGLLPVESTALPLDKVLFIGDPVACVVARDRYIAEDAAALVEVDYEALEAAASFDAAVADGAPLLYDDVPGNLVSHQAFSSGAPENILDTAEIVVEAAFHQHRVTHAPMETRGCIAEWDEGQQRLTFRLGSQAPHPLRSQLARRLMLEESQVRIICPDIGGAFGQKIALLREELVVAALSRHLRRPVRWLEDRMENLLAAVHARQESCRTRAAVSPDGRILALTLSMDVDFGAYCFYPANYMARVVAMILTGPYRISSYGYDVKVALTNKCGSGPMRAPMAIASWVMEGTIEAIARRLGLDPVAVRRVNLLRDADLPYAMQTGEVAGDITPAQCLDRLLADAEYDAFRKRQAEDRERGVYRGLGLCSVVEPSTYGSAFYKAAAIPGSGHEAGWVKVEPSGAVNASVGLMGSGHGYETVFAQVVAEGLGVDAETVRIHMGDTDVAPYGMGTRGARGATAGGSVLLLAAQAVRRKALTIAASMLNLNTADELQLQAGRVQRRLADQWSDTGVTLASIAHVAYLDPLRLPEGLEPGLEAHRAYDPPPMTYSNAAHACEVLVDVRTGKVTVERHTVVEDCGRVLNPMIVEGQQHGAIAMGLSGALLEEVVYDEDGQNLTGSFADYSIATAVEIPPMRVINLGKPSSSTPIGSKGMSEGGVMGAIGAVTNAVNDALAPFGVVAERLPLSPQYLRSLLRGKT
ncbi:xanthine dehydrogenase family protein molybdopterin-binding subunit [Arvimicrobium flavum]|uniref:xanthine dehydrogenase family protein molybdopterin-binding subunit n=1 Tax=Arvimicrobium flavum TaxID=3393320 RepID=UPI00237C4C03|nr:xanthine dehydrogenase family protein molybdopterin-binding subunit [Mesorhizobium shangrilense]